MQTNNIDERLIALKNLHNEVLLTSRTKFRRNTARVLIEVMKEIIRSYGDEEKQLQLAHDFRIAATGKPTIVRKLLRRYHLLEMPEKWNQLVFDHHVHDANTKGRKSPTHLIMDAWVKGIRSLTVIYYNYIKPETAYELLEASKIMGVKIRIGLLYNIMQSTSVNGGKNLFIKLLKNGMAIYAIKSMKNFLWNFRRFLRKNIKNSSALVKALFCTLQR